MVSLKQPGIPCAAAIEGHSTKLIAVLVVSVLDCRPSYLQGLALLQLRDAESERDRLAGRVEGLEAQLEEAQQRGQQAEQALADQVMV